MDRQDLLREASELFGIEPGYWDIAGVWHETTPELREAILQSLGINTSAPADLERSLDDRLLETWGQLGEPVRVVTQGAPVHVDLHIDQASANGWVMGTLVREDASRTHIRFDLSEWPTEETRTIRGTRYLRKRVSIPVPLPLGYHSIDWELRGDPAGSTRISTLPSGFTRGVTRIVTPMSR